LPALSSRSSPLRPRPHTNSPPTAGALLRFALQSPSLPSGSTPPSSPSRILRPIPERLPPPPLCIVSKVFKNPAVAAAGTETVRCGEGCMRRRRSGGDDCGLAIRSRSRWGKKRGILFWRQERRKIGSWEAYSSLAKMQNGDGRKKNAREMDFFAGYGDVNRYEILEVIGKGSYGLVCSANDTHTGEKVAIKKIHNIFEHISDAARILREIKLLRLLRHPDIVEIKHIMLPPSKRDFKDIYVVFELMESDLHQVIKANDDLTREHYQFFLYQMLRALKYIHTANVYHRDLKPKNVLANANCKLKICDFGLARVAFNDAPTTVFWTDYVATRWYRAPELCGSFYSKYTPAIDIWSIGCIFAEVLIGKPLFPGKNVVHQLDLITDLLGTPPLDAISKALADPYFNGLAKMEREPSCQPIPKVEFEFERRRVTKDDIKELIFREILEYNPQLLKEYTMLLTNLGNNLPNWRKMVAEVDYWRQYRGNMLLCQGKPSTTTRPLMSCDSQHAQAMSDRRSLAPAHPWQPNIIHLQNQAHFQNPPVRGSLLDATGPAQYLPGAIPSVASRPGHVYLYLHQSVTAEAVPSDRTPAQAISASHGPVPAVPYSIQGIASSELIEREVLYDAFFRLEALSIELS
ncbi:hypothetical protein EJB05_44228, partial [Eragrostis curvula]